MRRPRLLAGACMAALLAVVWIASSRSREEPERVAAVPGPATFVSPAADNGRIAFVRRTSTDPVPKIMTMNADGTDAAVLVEHAGASDLAWSPDGTRLAFSDGKDIFVVDGDGRGLDQLTTDGAANASPTWSPDGARIAFSSGIRGASTAEIWVMAADGSDQRPVDGLYSGRDPAWSPDGTRIAASTVDGSSDDIVVFTLDGSDEPLVLVRDGFEDQPSWSPDGRRIAFRHNGDISVVTADGNGATPLATPPPTSVNTPPGSGSPIAPAWSPDGTAIAYALLGSEDACSIWMMNADGSGQRQVTSGDACDYDVSWQPVPRR